MERESPRGAILFTLAVGLMLAIGGLWWLQRPPTVGGEPVVRATPTPSPSPTPTAIPLSPDQFHSKLVSRSPDPTLAAGATATVALVFTNTGTTPWVKGTATEARLGVKLDERGLSDLGMAVNWPLPTRPAVQQEPSVGPGKTATFTFQVKAVNPGVFQLPVRLVIDGVTWMEDEGIFVIITVRA